MNLANPYGDGNHHRMSWRRAWDVDVDGLTATHRESGFVVAFTGEIIAMPGLPKVPAAEAIDVDENGEIVGLF